MTVHPIDFSDDNVPQDPNDMQYRPNFQDIPDQETEVQFRPFQHPASPSILYPAPSVMDPEIANKLKAYEDYIAMLNRVASTGIPESTEYEYESVILTISRRD